MNDVTEDDMVKLRNGARMLGWFLRKDLDETFSNIKITPGQRKLTEEARAGLLETIATYKQKAEKKVRLSESEYNKALEDDFPIQEELFGPDGKPRVPADKNGKVIETKRTFNNDKPPTDDGIDPKDGVQMEIEEEENPGLPPKEADQQPEPGSDPAAWSVKAGVPQHVEMRIKKAIGKPMSRAEAVKYVAKNTNLTPLQVDGYVDQMIKDGKLILKGKQVKLPEETGTDQAEANADQAPTEEAPAEVATTEATTPSTPPPAYQCILALLTNNKDKLNQEQVIAILTASTPYLQPDVLQAFQDLEEDKRIKKDSKRGWVPVEGSTVGIESTTAAAILVKLDEGQRSKQLICDAVAMELNEPLDLVQTTFTNMLFASIIERSPLGGYQSANRPAAVA